MLRWAILLCALIAFATALPLALDELSRLSAAHIESFPPLQTVIETILVDTDGFMNVDFQDAFCNGSNFTIYDNNVFVATIISPLPRFCSVDTSSYIPIVSPTFSHFVYFMGTGFHNITVVVFDSPLADGTTALRITFKPTEPTAKYNILAKIRRTRPQ